MLNRFGAWSAVALLAALVLVGCGKTTKKQENPPTVTMVNVTYVVPTAGPATPTTAPSEGGSATTAATQPTGAGQVINLDMEDIKFSTNAIEIPANTDVTIHLTNKGATAHDFSIDALNISTGDVAPGATKDVKINAPAGDYTYYCNVPGHEAAGMKGTLTVKAGAAPTSGAETSPAASGLAAGASPAASPEAALSPTAASPIAASSPVTASSPAAVASPVASPVAASSPVASPVGASSPATTPATAGGAQTVNLEMIDIAFKPTTLDIPANTDSVIHITNTGSTAHDFSIDKLNITTGDVAPGATIDVKINAPAGEYTYYCNVPGHEAAGMKGTLTVK
jgi:uncharacterized cupredoxin-like copper-binding protein